MAWVSVEIIEFLGMEDKLEEWLTIEFPIERLLPILERILRELGGLAMLDSNGYSSLQKAVDNTEGVE